MTTTDERPSTDTFELPRWSVADVHESLEARSFTDALEQAGADAERLVALFDELDIRAKANRPVTDADGAAADTVLRELNRVTDGAMVNVCLTWAAGFGLFVATFSAAAAYPAPLFELEVRLVRRLAKVIKLLVLALELLALPSVL